MKLEELKKLMPDASSDLLKSTLKTINDDAKAQIDTEVKGLKDNNQKNIERIKKLKESQIPEGYNQEAYDKYVKEKDSIEAQKKDLEDKKLEDKGQWDALKIKLVDSNSLLLKKTTDDLNGEISILKGALDNELIENAAIKAIDKEKGNSFFLLPHIKPFLKTVKGEDNKFSTQVIDSDGTQRFKEDATTAFSINDLVAEMKSKDQFSPAFPDGNSGSGNGAGGGGGGGSTVNPWKKDTQNVTEQGKMIKDNPVLAEQMKKSANVK